MKRLKKKKSAKPQLLKQGLADARKRRVRQAKEDDTKYVPRDKPLSETNLYMKDPKLRDKMILVSAASSSAIEGIRVPRKVLAKALRPGWKPPRPRRRRS